MGRDGFEALAGRIQSALHAVILVVVVGSLAPFILFMDMRHGPPDSEARFHVPCLPLNRMAGARGRAAQHQTKKL